MVFYRINNISFFKYIFVKVIPFCFSGGNPPQLIPNKLILLIAYILGVRWGRGALTLVPCPLCCARAAGRASRWAVLCWARAVRCPIPGPGAPSPPARAGGPAGIARGAAGGEDPRAQGLPKEPLEPPARRSPVGAPARAQGPELCFCRALPGRSRRAQTRPS